MVMKASKRPWGLRWILKLYQVKKKVEKEGAVQKHTHYTWGKPIRHGWQCVWAMAVEFCSNLMCEAGTEEWWDCREIRYGPGHGSTYVSRSLNLILDEVGSHWKKLEKEKGNCRWRTNRLSSHLWKIISGQRLLHVAPGCRAGTNRLKDKRDFLNDRICLRVSCLLRRENHIPGGFEAPGCHGNFRWLFPKYIQQITHTWLIWSFLGPSLDLLNIWDQGSEICLWRSSSWLLRITAIVGTTLNRVGPDDLEGSFQTFGFYCPWKSIWGAVTGRL